MLDGESQEMVMKPNISVVDASKRLDVDKFQSNEERVKAMSSTYYNEYVTNMLKLWLKSDKTVDDVVKWLKLDNLREDELLPYLDDRNYKAFVKLKAKSLSI